MKPSIPPEEVQEILKENQNYKFFQNTKCPFFPCHKVPDVTKFNCLFCYCPLYALNKNCGGNFKILENGIKDCSGCIFPHQKDNYEKVMAKSMELVSRCQKENSNDKNEK